MRRISKLNNLLACIGLLAISTASASPAFSQGIALGQSDLMRQLRETGTIMKEYASTHDHYPNTTDEMDNCLKMLYTKVSMTTPDSTVQVQQNGRYRTFYQFAIGIDPSYKSTPIVNGIPQPDQSLSMPASTIVLMTDGQDEIVGWAAGIDGSPWFRTRAKVPYIFTIRLSRKTKAKSSCSRSTENIASKCSVASKNPRLLSMNSHGCKKIRWHYKQVSQSRKHCPGDDFPSCAGFRNCQLTRFERDDQGRGSTIPSGRQRIYYSRYQLRKFERQAADGRSVYALCQSEFSSGSRRSGKKESLSNYPRSWRKLDERR